MHRNNISENLDFLFGSSDFDRSGKVSAWLKTSLVMKLMYPMLKTGGMPERIRSVMKKRHPAEKFRHSEQMYYGKE